MRFYFIRSLDEWLQFLKSEKEALKNHSISIKKYIPSKEREFRVKGYSWPSDSVVNFICDFKYSKGFPHVNWRERLVCPETTLNNRMRFSVTVIDVFSDIRSNDLIYIMEQVTPFYEFLKLKYKNLVGSEFIRSDLPSGFVSERGVRNEDATKLSFGNDEFKIVLSFDVFEHIPNYLKAFQEAHRILEVNGKLIFTAPFDVNSESNLIRAKVGKEGNIEHICEPEYHGDPMNNEGGILCYQHFGWEMIDELKEAGFSDAYAVIGFSESLGNFTPQVIFIAKK